MSKHSFTLLVIPCLLVSSMSLGQESYWLGDSRGPYATGTYAGMWVDEAREEVTTAEQGDKRRVMFQIWYPAIHEANADFAPYIFNPELFQEYIQEWGEELAASPTRSVLNAEMNDAEGPFPVLLYSHGGNSPLFTGTAQTEFLASHGYIVVSVAHTDDSALMRFPDGKEYEPIAIQQVPDEEQSEGWSELQIYRWQKEHLQDLHDWHVKDISFVLDTLVRLNRSADSVFYEQLDLDQVGAFGWSRGGATSFQASIEDERIRAAANLDGTLFGRSIEISGSTRPLLLLESTDSYFDPLNHREANPELEELWASVESDWWGMFSRSSHDWYRGKILGTNHNQFADFPLANAAPPEEFIRPQRARDIINAVLLEFFDQYLRNAADSPLLQGQNAFPELRLVTEKEEQ